MFGIWFSNLKAHFQVATSKFSEVILNIYHNLIRSFTDKMPKGLYVYSGYNDADLLIAMNALKHSQ